MIMLADEAHSVTKPLAVEVAVVWVLWLAVIAAFTFLLFGFRRNAARLTRRVETLQVQPTVTFSGGMRSRHGGGTRGGWARLQFFDWGIRLDGRSLLPTFEVRYEEITEARLVATRFKGGIRFQSCCLTEPVTFETSEGAKIGDLLEERGVTVNRDVGHLGWLPGD
jgi:hypothetical protein